MHPTFKILFVVAMFLLVIFVLLWMFERDPRLKDDRLELVFKWIVVIIVIVGVSYQMELLYKYGIIK